MEVVGLVDLKIDSTDFIKCTTDYLELKTPWEDEIISLIAIAKIKYQIMNTYIYKIYDKNL